MNYWNHLPADLENFNNGRLLLPPPQFIPNTTFLGPRREERFQLTEKEYFTVAFPPNPNFEIPMDQQNANFTLSLPPTLPTTSLATLQEHHQRHYQHYYNNGFSPEQLPQMYMERPPTKYKPYICKVCEKKYDTWEGMAMHQNLHNHGDGWTHNFLCEICGRTFPTLYILEAHLNEHIHKDIQEFTCPVCPEYFSDRKDIVKHLDVHINQEVQTTRKRKSYSPDKDDCQNTNKNKVKATQTTENSREYRCTKCNESFGVQRSLEIHTETCSKINRFKCKGCGKEFDTRTDLTLHLHLNNGDVSNTCEKCGEIFHFPCTLQKHMKTKHKEKKSYTCPICPEKYSEADDLIKHLDEHQQQFKTNKCEQCEESFEYKHQLNTHRMKIHGQEKLKPFACKQCDKRFVGSKGLSCHVSQKHVALKICGVCQKMFNLQRDLTEHMRTEHRTKRLMTFTCEKCLESFDSIQKLKHHTFIHLKNKCTSKQINSDKSSSDKNASANKLLPHTAGEVPVTCKHCQKRFTSELLLEQHLESRNRGESHVCVDCKLEFCVESQLEAHLKIHGTETPHMCEHCGMYFPRRGVLDYHLGNNSVEDPLVCQYCSCSFIWKCARDAHLKVVHVQDIIPSITSESTDESSSARLSLPTNHTFPTPSSSSESVVLKIPEIIDLT